MQHSDKSVNQRKDCCIYGRKGGYMISEKKSGAPYLNVWFGNFYRPAYDDEAFVAEGDGAVKKSLDSTVFCWIPRDWGGFFGERYGGKACEPVCRHARVYDGADQKAGDESYISGDLSECG